MKGIKIALNPVGAGDSPVRGNVRVSGQKGAAFGGFLCPPAGQISEIRNQRSDAVQAGFTQSCGYAEKLMFSVVGAGLKQTFYAFRSRKVVRTLGFHEIFLRRF